MIVKADITGGSIGRVSFLPCLIGTDYQPRILESGSPDFDDLVTFMRHSAKENDIRTELAVDGAEVVAIR
jgi:hypothetical protein